MKKFLYNLYTSSPKETLHRVRSRLRLAKSGSTNKKVQGVSEELQKRFSMYQTSNLQSVGKEEFSQHIQSKIGVIDAESEGFTEDELERQRGLSIKYHWGHNHDFGDFKLEGRMGDRHINLMTNFISLFPVTIENFKDKRVFDIGCWTGGTTLLLGSLGSEVLAIEEVKKYAETVTYLSKSFGIDGQVSVKSMSLYDCNSEEFHDRFDIVYFPGVIYHLSDPLLALRILFNSLKEGGIILVESAGTNREEPVCIFTGSLINNSGSRERLNRGGWNWFIPSPTALHRMMREAGFDEIDTRWHHGTKRVYGYGKKVSQVGICKAGLSVPSIK